MLAKLIMKAEREISESVFGAVGILKTSAFLFNQSDNPPHIGDISE